MKKLRKPVIGILLVFGMLLIGVIFLLQKVFFSNEEPQEISEPVDDHSIEDFIGEIGEDARNIAGENDLYASVLLAQAILESDQGRSGLASEPNFNLFGMKGEYQADFVELETQEDDGEGNMTTIVAKFRKYPSYEESIADYVELLRNGVSWDTQFYEGTYKSNTSSYEEATAFLTGTYATDSQYEEKLNQLIETYDLQQYDLLTKDVEEANAEPEDKLN